ncbi:hypothetical protein Afil01_16570 [Actinorhabdospora filicis]|uniref:Methyltransferase type 11 domain-containing protein n=1 Tax=Actinorhabdospora filicis TaxID=1785913 RepID=A0A9W6W9Q1_9ACTN|nr:methyltransferase domain-containing protein [Actinorhabdospora filicis]GLZ76850.1 hypothetical protein Afil01_16570 [Actinorhabdospora filicis]
MSATYTHGHHASVLRSHQWRTAENSAAYLLPHLTGTERLLDLGCGPGTITADLATRVASVVAVDAAADVLDQAREACAGVSNVEFQTADAYALPFSDASFDVVHAHQVLQHLGDPVAALREMRRVTRPGGLVAARDADYEVFTWFPASPELTQWLALVRAVHRGNGGDPDAGRKLLSWTRAAGFEDVTASGSTWVYADDEGRAWWGGMWADRILDSAVARQAVELGLATREELTEMSAAWREWAASPDGWFMVPHGEVLARA